MKIEIVTDIVQEPVTLPEVKSALKITGTGHDDELSRLITDARVYVEKACDISVLERELKVTDEDELEEDELPFGPVADLTVTEDTTNEVYVHEYTGGFTETPADIKRLITDLIKFWYDIDDPAAPLPAEIKKKIMLNSRQP